MSSINRFFDKVYVISLFDRMDRWNKVKKAYKTRGIKVQRFVAIDGRCKDQGEDGCLDKLRSFEIAYNVVIKNKEKKPLTELLPAASLTIGTILLLRNMIRKKYSSILIAEDDVIIGRDIEKKFRKGVKELQKYRKNWDILYLGCGSYCGSKGVGDRKSKINRHESQLNMFYEYKNYVQNKLDLRLPCDDCEVISDMLSVPLSPGGTWQYAISLKGAKKLVKILEKDAGKHIDRAIQEIMNSTRLKVVAFDPPIVWHEDGAFRADSDIPWEW